MEEQRKLMQALLANEHVIMNSDFETRLNFAVKLNEVLSEYFETLNDMCLKLLMRVRSCMGEDSEEQEAEKLKSLKKIAKCVKGSEIDDYREGNKFFRDLNGRAAPNNEDYIKRKSEGEIFPMDFSLVKNCYWIETDKKLLLMGIKEQIVNTLLERKIIDIHWDGKMDYLHSSNLKDMLKKVDGRIEIDWFQISAGDLRSRHNETSCEAMWNVFLHPSLKRSKWTNEENNRLITAAKKYKFQNWEAIGKEVGGRSDYQCYIQYRTKACYNLPNRFKKWDKNDDIKLIELVHKNTTNNVTDWTTVTTYFRFKPKGDIIARYNTRLKPGINFKPFSPEEDILLIGLVKKYGEKFSIIPRDMFPDRTILQLRNRYLNTLKHRHRNTTWTYEDDDKLTKFVTEHGTSSWLKCAELLGNHTRTSCRTRFITIKRMFKKNPNLKLTDVPRHKILKSDNLVRPDHYETQLDLLESDEIGKLAYHPLISIKKELRLLELEMNASFKFGYDYSTFNSYFTKWPACIPAKNIMANALKIHTPMQVDNLLLTNLPFHFQKTVEKMMKAVAEQSLNNLPPNYSTLIAYRTLCSFRKLFTPNLLKVKNSYNNVDLTLFKQRFRSTFFLPGIMCCSNPSKLNIGPLEYKPENNDPEEIYHCGRYYKIQKVTDQGSSHDTEKDSINPPSK
ncbi:snRNA-activating protein complex subunit 4-like [Teleopsis dalmanni]|uniref:snRNA-activating protein complex subunit 4-like n=1 Tax=Teleopsis dalmanni TaxID=139649 RepID=UPI0018CDD29D|nr:snRNA-activating protein complex subunit 4-like [Teleopsis dalmanni]XP_037954456.1 snRNA-activating protein complex subunit 4-like [Teleopsis dalmanni]